MILLLKLVFSVQVTASKALLIGAFPGLISRGSINNWQQIEMGRSNKSTSNNSAKEEKKKYLLCLIQSL